MRLRIAVAVLGAAIMIFSCRYLLRAQTPERRHAAQMADTHSVWDGVYTAEQAKRGGDIYSSDCSTCHGAKLEGVDDSPSLAGKEFLDAWDGRSVGALFEQVRTKMPRNDPGRLNRQQDLDVVAYILSVNQFPAGKTELPQEFAPLKLIRIEAAKTLPKK